MKNNFTYGIELEGIFEPNFIGALNTENILKEGKQDGSVSSRNIISFFGLEHDDIFYDDNDRIVCEITSKVLNLKQLKTFLKITNKYYKKGFYFDNSCGIHIHIGAKTEKIDELRTTDFIWKVEKYIKDTYKELAFRFSNTGNGYCKTTSKTFNIAYKNIKTFEKYKVVRNHPQGTLEFRIFSPQDKEFENHILDLIKYVDNYNFVETIKTINTRDKSFENSGSEIIKTLSFLSQPEIDKLKIMNKGAGDNKQKIISMYSKFYCNRVVKGDNIITNFKLKD